MIGSLIIDLKGQNYNNLYPYYTVFVNGVLRYSHSKESEELYSTHLNLNDVVNLNFYKYSGITSDIGIYRKDYTTEDSFGNFGITNTKIYYSKASTTGFSYTFTATTLDNSYNFEYRVLSTTYSGFTPFNNIVADFEEQSDGKVIYGGYFSQYNEISSSRIIRLNTDNSVDETFEVGTGFGTGFTFINRVQILPDNKILLMGSFNSYKGETLAKPNIIVLNSNGSRDTTFNLPSNFTGSTQMRAGIDKYTDPDNYKIYLWGYTTTPSPPIQIFRFNKDGSLDNTFNQGTFNNNPLLFCEVQSDGKILVGGQFDSYSGNSSSGLVRLNYDGYYDNTFNIGSGFTLSGYPISAAVYTIQIQTDNKILIGGIFNFFNGQSANGIVRLNSNGSMDSSFYYGTGFSGTTPSWPLGYIVPYTYNIKLTSEPKILINHFNSYYNGNYSPYITKLFFNGTIDNSFNTGLRFDFITNGSTSKELFNNTIVSVSDFVSYNGIFSPYAVKTDLNGNYLNWN